MGNLRLNWVRYRVRVYTIWLLKVNVGKSRVNVTKDIEELTTQLEWQSHKRTPQRRASAFIPIKFCHVIKLNPKYFCRTQAKEIARHRTAASFVGVVKTSPSVPPSVGS